MFETTTETICFHQLGFGESRLVPSRFFRHHHPSFFRNRGKGAFCQQKMHGTCGNCALETQSRVMNGTCNHLTSGFFTNWGNKAQHLEFENRYNKQSCKRVTENQTASLKAFAWGWGPFLCGNRPKSLSKANRFRYRLAKGPNNSSGTWTWTWRMDKDPREVCLKKTLFLIFKGPMKKKQTTSTKVSIRSPDKRSRAVRNARSRHQGSCFCSCIPSRRSCPLSSGVGISLCTCSSLEQ